MAYPDHWMSELLAKNDIVSVVSTYTDLPFLVALDEVASADGRATYRPGKNLVAGDFANHDRDSENAMFWHMASKSSVEASTMLLTPASSV